jgi:hypothetical protein
MPWCSVDAGVALARAKDVMAAFRLELDPVTGEQHNTRPDHPQLTTSRCRQKQITPPTKTAGQPHLIANSMQFRVKRRR